MSSNQQEDDLDSILLGKPQNETEEDDVQVVLGNKTNTQNEPEEDDVQVLIDDQEKNNEENNDEEEVQVVIEDKEDSKLKFSAPFTSCGIGLPKKDTFNEEKTFEKEGEKDTTMNLIGFHFPYFNLLVDVDAAEEKPWRLPGADLTDYFNYGFNEDTWREYCNKQISLRVSRAMGAKIQVYESTHIDDTVPPDEVGKYDRVDRTKRFLRDVDDAVIRLGGGDDTDDYDRRGKRARH